MSVTHGLASTYRNSRYACRCDLCKHAHAERQRRELRRRTEALASDPSLAPHGQCSTYRNWGCRCRPCTDAHMAKYNAWKARRDEAQP